MEYIINKYIKSKVEAAQISHRELPVFSDQSIFRLCPSLFGYIVRSTENIPARVLISDNGFKSVIYDLGDNEVMHTVVRRDGHKVVEMKPGSGSVSSPILFCRGTRLPDGTSLSSRIADEIELLTGSTIFLSSLLGM